MIRVQMTFDRVTPESAEVGDFSDHGFAEPGGWRYSIADEDFQSRVKRYELESYAATGKLNSHDSRLRALADMTPEPTEYDTAADVIEALRSDIRSGEASCSPPCNNGHCWITAAPTTDGDTEERISYHFDCDNPADHVAIIKALTR